MLTKTYLFLVRHALVYTRIQLTIFCISHRNKLNCGKATFLNIAAHFLKEHLAEKHLI